MFIQYIPNNYVGYQHVWKCDIPWNNTILVGIMMINPLVGYFCTLLSNIFWFALWTCLTWWMTGYFSWIQSWQLSWPEDDWLHGLLWLATGTLATHGDFFQVAGYLRLLPWRVGLILQICRNIPILRPRAEPDVGGSTCQNTWNSAETHGARNRKWGT